MPTDFGLAEMRHATSCRGVRVRLTGSRWLSAFSGLQATWMAGLQGSVVLGIVLGYIVAGSFVTNWSAIRHDSVSLRSLRLNGVSSCVLV